jgi:hypothetical protein
MWPLLSHLVAFIPAVQDGCTAAVQRVPAVKDLPAIVSAMLVKPIPPALDASGEGLFTTVIPDNRCILCLCAARSRCKDALPVKHVGSVI